MRGHRSRRDRRLDLAWAHDSAGGDLRQAGDPGHLADQRQQAVVSPGLVVVHERAPVRAGLVTLDAERVRARRGGQDRLAGTGHGDHDEGPGVLQGADHLGGRAAEGEANDRGRIGQQRRDLIVVAIVVPAALAQRPGGAQGPEIPFQRRGVRARRAGHEDVHPERFRRRRAHGGDLGGHRGGRLVPGGQEAQCADAARRDHQFGGRRPARHRGHDDRAP